MADQERHSKRLQLYVMDVDARPLEIVCPGCDAGSCRPEETVQNLESSSEYQTGHALLSYLNA